MLIAVVVMFMVGALAGLYFLEVNENEERNPSRVR